MTPIDVQETGAASLMTLSADDIEVMESVRQMFNEATYDWLPEDQDQRTELCIATTDGAIRTRSRVHRKEAERITTLLGVLLYA